MIKIFNVKDYGVVGDGVADDRLGFQAALDAAAGGVLLVPDGVYALSQRPNAYYALRISNSVEIRGESRAGVKLRLMGGVGTSVQMFWIENVSDVCFRSLSLDGQRSQQTVNPQRHGIFARRCPNLLLEDIQASDFTGDGTHVHDGSNHVLVRDSIFSGNARNGLTLGGGTDDVTFLNCKFVGNGAEQLDSEHGLANHVTITGCEFDTLGASDDFVLTMTGGSAESRSSHWTVTNNIINGSVLILWITDVVYAHNRGVNASTRPSIYVYRSVDRVLIHRNELHTTGAAGMDGGSMIHVVGTNPGSSAGGVLISQNKLTTEHPCYGVSAVCARDVQIVDNEISGAPGTRNECGVYLRATRVLEPMVSAIVQRNSISKFSGYGVRLGGNGEAKIQRVVIADNVISDGIAALNLNDGLDEAQDVTAFGNFSTSPTLLVHPPSGTQQPWGDGSRWIVPAV